MTTHTPAPTPTVARVIEHLQQLRATLAHALKQPNLSAARFNEIRAQLGPLDDELMKLGVTEFEVLPQMAPTYIRLSRHQRRKRQQHEGRFSSYESKVRQKFARGNDDAES
jgi:hypothetical protein